MINPGVLLALGLTEAEILRQVGVPWKRVYYRCPGHVVAESRSHGDEGTRVACDFPGEEDPRR
jgi:hypothetical protein